jgi:hypothetical protein
MSPSIRLRLRDGKSPGELTPAPTRLISLRGPDCCMIGIAARAKRMSVPCPEPRQLTAQSAPDSTSASQGVPSVTDYDANCRRWRKPAWITHESCHIVACSKCQPKKMLPGLTGGAKESNPHAEFLSFSWQRHEAALVAHLIT